MLYTNALLFTADRGFVPGGFSVKNDPPQTLCLPHVIAVGTTLVVARRTDLRPMRLPRANTHLCPVQPSSLAYWANSRR